jgi:sodium transport system permease protein
VLTQPLVIARKELVDHARDVRSVALTALYSLMGPAVVLLALLQRGAAAPASGEGQPWPLMAAVFALMAAFTGSMAAAMDTIAGERERRSLVPLIVSSRSRRDLMIGKWMALSLFSTIALAINIAAFGLVLTLPDAGRPVLSWLLLAPALLSLGLLAPACEILISTICRSTKEANTYVSLLVFGIMGVAMWTAFRADAGDRWSLLVPVLGQQRLLEVGFSGSSSSVVELGLLGLQSLALTGATALVTIIVLAAASRLFQRDEAIYGG